MRVIKLNQDRGFGWKYGFFGNRAFIVWKWAILR